LRPSGPNKCHVISQISYKYGRICKYVVCYIIYVYSVSLIYTVGTTPTNLSALNATMRQSVWEPDKLDIAACQGVTVSQQQPYDILVAMSLE